MQVFRLADLSKRKPEIQASHICLHELQKINEKLVMTSHFDLTWFYDVIMRNSVF